MDINKRRIASLALFRNLYNEGRSDVMTILCEFAKNTRCQAYLVLPKTVHNYNIKTLQHV